MSNTSEREAYDKIKFEMKRDYSSQYRGKFDLKRTLNNDGLERHVKNELIRIKRVGLKLDNRRKTKRMLKELQIG